VIHRLKLFRIQMLLSDPYFIDFLFNRNKQ